MNKLLIILFPLISSICYSQTYIDVTNQYIQNPSFEDYSACPQSNSVYPTDMWIDSVTGWYAPTAGTSDYFNACNNGSNNVPNGYLSGFQNAFDGNAFCGFFAYAPDYTQNNRMWCEYVQTQLLQPLEATKYYRFSMRINRANDYNLAVKNIGANFTQYSSLDFSSTKPFNIIPTILNSTGYITDTLNWTLVQGVFQASGNENFLTIGWFGDTLTSDFTFFIPPDIDPNTGDSTFMTETYYLVDSIKLYEIQENINDFDLNLITPNGDNVNDVIDFSAFKFNELHFTIFNRWGNIIWETKDPNLKWEGKNLSGELVSGGVYFYILVGVDYYGVNINKRGFVQVVR